MMEQNSKEHNDIKKSIADFGKKLDDSLANMEKNFAGKWVEKTLIRAAGVLGASLLCGLLYLIYKVIIHLGDIIK